MVLNKTSSHAFRDGLDDSFLCRSLGLVNSEDVVLLRLIINNLLGHTSQVTNVNGWDEVLAIANDLELGWALHPGILEMGIESALTVAVADTTAKNVNFEHWLRFWRGHCK